MNWLSNLFCRNKLTKNSLVEKSKCIDSTISKIVVSGTSANFVVGNYLKFLRKKGDIGKTNLINKFIESHSDNEARDRFDISLYEIEPSPEIRVLSNRWKFYKIKCSDLRFSDWMKSI